MAEQITALSRSAGRPRKYPWEQWADGNAWRIKHGEDFEITPHSMAGVIRSHALRHGARARVVTLLDAVEFQFIYPEGKAA